MAKQSFNEQVMKSFGSALRAAREAAGYKYAKTFAETLGVPDHRYRAWERGEYTPNLMTLTRMCRLLDVEPNALLPLALKHAGKKSTGSSDPRAAA